MPNFDSEIFQRSDLLAEKIQVLIDMPLLNESARIITSDVACSLSFEHWHSVRALLECGLLSSSIVIHRAQFESLVRAVWITYSASEDQIDKLSTDLNLESEQAAKNLPQVAEMIASIGKSGPREAFNALSRFKDNSWKALNSYVHAGIHPIGVLGIFRPKTTKCSGGHAVRGLQRGITFLALHIASHNKSIT
ncbi:MAG TPA: hypothetical protein VF433_08330 [Cellvibrio sp.]